MRKNNINQKSQKSYINSKNISDIKVGEEEMRSIKLGSDNFKTIIEEGSLFVDKSLFIDDIIKANTLVQLFTRPRRFGKTTNLSMLKYFFNMENKEENRKLFTGLKIEKTKSMEHFGQYPVILISFKDVKQGSFQEAKEFIKLRIGDVYSEHKYLLNILEGQDKEYFQDMISYKKYDVNLLDSFFKLTEYLYKYHNKKVVLLIDEYDTPLITAYEEGYYEEMIKFFRVLYALVIKNNDNLQLGVLTGINRISKEGMFSGLNNVKVNSILSDEYGEYFGFTEEEVKELLEEYELSHTYEEVKKWYDGYNFGGKSVYNPWSFTLYLKSGKFDVYWINTGGDTEIKMMLNDVASKKTFEDLSKLVENGNISVEIDENVIFKDLQNTKQLWNLLLNAGYLTIKEKGRRENYKLRIPNYEIESYFSRVFIQQYLNTKDQSFNEVLEVLENNELNLFEKKLKENILNSVSFMEQDKESFYQGYFTGLFSGLKETYYVRGNRESGYGRYDLYLEPIDKQMVGYIIEIKVCNNKEEMKIKVTKALEQIKEMEYYRELLSRNIKRIDIIALVFYKKEFIMKVEKIR